MTSNTFQLLSGQEVIDLKRSRGIMACAECQRRKLKCDKQFPCTSCVRRGRADICPTGDVGPIGRGRRIVRSDLLGLGTTIHTMGDRIRDLETAVAAAHGEESNSTHPLLREDLLSIKRPTELPQSSGAPIPAQLANSFGALAMSASGTSRYFGPTAGPSALLSAQGFGGGDRAEFASPFADLTGSLPFNGSGASWDTALCVEGLLQYLPDDARAWVLYEIYINDSTWFGTPIMPEELREFVNDVYASNFNPNDLSPHALAVIFLVFALATLADLSLPPYDVQADAYFDLGRTALTLQSVFGSNDLHTVQALSLAGIYYTTGGARYSADSSWTITSMAVNLCRQFHLHLEESYTGIDDKIAQRRRALFWEVYSQETYMALSFSRPVTILLADITCDFPTDTEQTIAEDDGRTIPGFFHTKWKLTTEVTAPMSQVYTSATPPTYEEVLDLDRRLRQFMEQAPFNHYKGSTFSAYLRSNLIPRFSGDLMLYMHRSSFVQALKDSPHNPLESPYAASYLAAYRGALKIIQSDIRSFTLYPQHFHRWWPIWKSLVNAAFIVGSIVVKGPTSEFAPVAFTELLSAVRLVEQGAMHSFFAQGSLPVLQRLRNKASVVYATFHSPTIDAALGTINPSDLADDQDLEMLGGSRALLDRNSLPVPTSTGPATLIPGFISPMNTECPSWQPQILTSNFAPDVQADGLEAYLAAQMQSTPYSDAVPEASWTTFIESLQ
ncbi:fungal-specific transcription factor domain-containing protein [Mycena maculata]|uniref:Fungal-specific transcription factor domain-containing protein n=1 Tax=Mycena maculata TaxID=230809 RepID=A0AAD7NUS4_9AGAR|nr:fungal-specific transcription factor domain-containing protein [Mycena maculata]